MRRASKRLGLIRTWLLRLGNGREEINITKWREEFGSRMSEEGDREVEQTF